MTIGQTALFHSFPRRQAGKSGEKALARKILCSILDSGLLLLPEVVGIPEEIELQSDSADEPGGRTLSAIQRRFCLTMLASREVVGHKEVFGRCSVQFSAFATRLLGAIPVIYLPLGASEEGNSALGVTLLHCLAEAQCLLTRLQARSEQRAKGELEPALETAFAELISGVRAPSRLAATIQLVSQLFYPCDRSGSLNQAASDSLDYYGQREWRILDGFTRAGKPTSDHPTAAERDYLVQIDKEFFLGSVSFPRGSKLRIDEARFLRKAGDQPVSTLIERVLVPGEWAGEFQGILQERALDTPVVAYETLSQATC